jgi:putative membrane protein
LTPARLVRIVAGQRKGDSQCRVAVPPMAARGTDDRHAASRRRDTWLAAHRDLCGRHPAAELRAARAVARVQLGLVVVLPLAFALLHGAMRHGIAGIAVFAILCFVVSNAFENLGVETGFPFGQYFYTDAMGLKLFVVPLLIGPAYFGAGYTSWVLASILLGEIDRVPDRLAVVAIPVVAAFIMVGWDVCFDPGSSTLCRLWIWQDGGGYFGVPLTNYLGWYLTVFVFLFVLSLYRARRQITDATRLSSTYWAQPGTRRIFTRRRRSSACSPWSSSPSPACSFWRAGRAAEAACLFSRAGRRRRGSRPGSSRPVSVQGRRRRAAAAAASRRCARYSRPIRGAPASYGGRRGPR